MMQYNCYQAHIEYNDEARVFHGEVLNLKDIITFEGTCVEDLRQAFQDSVEDYLEFCHARGEKPEKPFLCVYSEELLSNRGEEALPDADEHGSFRKAQTNGTMVQVTAVFGFTLSGLVIQDIVRH